METMLDDTVDTLDLTPARWIWLPSGRTLPNTFVLFRLGVALPGAPGRATAWVTADSRYRFTVNGVRVGWGPAPCDPRYLDVDPLDLTPYLRAGPNVLGAEVLYYGHGDGTWAAGKPGFLCRVEIEDDAGDVTEIVSDDTWLTYLDRAHAPGQYKRWYLRALQEDFDARLHPDGWDTPGFVPDARWMPAMALDCPADKPAASGSYPDYAGDMRTAPAGSALRPRAIPSLREVDVAAARLQASGRVLWRRDPRDWFDLRVPDSYRIDRASVAVERGSGSWELPATPDPMRAAFATFEFTEQVVGWPYVSIEAPEGTIVELMCQEAHDPNGEPWLDTHFYAWSRFTCRAGLNRFETFDFESLRWLQVHVRNAAGPIILRAVGVRRRLYPWPHDARVVCAEPALQRLFDAGVNTLHNSAQETVVDGMGRERQQYSGDAGHQLHAVRYIFGETRLPRRYLRTFGQGLTRDGYFLDTWPGYDRLARLPQRQIDATPWGPLLDHSVGFVFDCWDHYLETGDLDAVREQYPRLLRFADYLGELRGTDGLLPVEDIGVPSVWIDHTAYRRQRHKQCAFNLYAAAMLEHALAPLSEASGDPARAERCARAGRGLLSATVARFWDAGWGLFVCNRPWLDEEGDPRLCDRSLAMSVLFDQCPGREVRAAVDALAAPPHELGLSYPANAGWRYRARARHGRVDVALAEFRDRWGTMESVVRNNTIAEFWAAKPDSTDEWSHCALAPLYVLAMDIVGLRPVTPGFARYVIRPQLGDIGGLDVTLHTPQGAMRFGAERGDEGHRVALTTPLGGEGQLVLPAGTIADLPLVEGKDLMGAERFRLTPGMTHHFVLPPPARAGLPATRHTPTT